MRFPSILAIDCGASRVSAAAFSATSEGVPVLERVMVEPLATESADDREWVTAVGEAIRRIGAALRVRGRRVTLLVPGHLTLTKYLRVPQVEESKRRKIVQFEARQNIPYPLEEVLWDYEVVHDDGVEFEVALCAIKAEIVEGLLAACRTAGFEPATVEPASMAQINAFRFCYREVRQGSLLINIGARSSNLVFMREDRSFVRTISYAGGAMTQAIADDLGEGLGEAERLKLEVFSRGAAGLEPRVGEAFESARQAFATRLALEVTRTIANYRRQSGVESPTRVFLTGAGAGIPGLDILLAEKLRTPVERYDPLRGLPLGAGAVESELRAQSHFVGEAIGAALRAYDQGFARFEFLPPRILKARAFRRRQPFLVASAALVAGALAIPVLVGSVTLAAYREKLANLEAQAAPLRRFSQEIQRTTGQRDRIRRQIEGIEGLVETKSNWISFFTDLQERLVKVEDVWLERLQVLRPRGPGSGTSALAGSLFGGLAAPGPASGATPAQPVAPPLRLNLAGRLLDKNNPLSKVSPESQQRVRTLLNSFTESTFIIELENERFDTSQPGLLKFDFILVVNSQHPL